MNRNERDTAGETGGHDAAALSGASASGQASRFTFGRDCGERASDINNLYNSFTGRSRPLEAYYWEWDQAPAGPSLRWTLTEAATGRIVGHHGIIPTALVRRGTVITAGRTENTIVEPSVRHKVFYAGLEKRALAEALHTFRVVYTIHPPAGLGPLRLRFGYKPVGRWAVYLARIGPRYLLALLQRARAKLALRLPDALLAVVAQVSARAYRLGAALHRGGPPLEIAEIGDVNELGAEYDDFWSRARQGYDLTLDRTREFLRWRIAENPHLRFRTWSLRHDGRLAAVVIGHRHALGGAAALYVDDVIVDEYNEASFTAALSCLQRIDPAIDTIILMTLAIDTPLHRVLQRRFPLQSFVLRRFGGRLFDEMLAVDREGSACDQPWYVMPVFTEGMDTSR